MRIALDASYSVDAQPTGIAVYSHELITGLARAFPGDEFLCCFRWKQLLLSGAIPFSNVRRRLLLPPFPTFHANLFHALNQRVDKRPAKIVVSTFHDLFVMTGDYATPEFRARFTEQARQAAARSDLIIAVSDFTAGQLCDLLRVERSRIRVIPHGVHRPQEEEPSKRENMILSIGSLQRRKNIIRLVAAFETLPADWTLVLAGSPNGFGAPEILRSIEQSPCADRIRVTGYITGKQRERLYRTASVFAFPSLAEGFGIPVLEAMANGTPVLTSYGSALKEVAGDAALLVDPEQSDEIAAGLLRLVHDAQLRTTLTERGLLRAQLYSWDRAIHLTRETYSEAVNRGGNYF